MAELHYDGEFGPFDWLSYFVFDEEDFGPVKSRDTDYKYIFYRNVPGQSYQLELMLTVEDIKVNSDGVLKKGTITRIKMEWSDEDVPIWIITDLNWDVEDIEADLKAAANGNIDELTFLIVEILYQIDTVVTGPGRDKFYDTWLYGGLRSVDLSDGDDRFYAGFSDPGLQVSGRALEIDGGTGNDTLDWRHSELAAFGITLDVIGETLEEHGDGTTHSVRGFETYILTNGDDHFTGSDQSERIYLYGGTDLVDMGGGNDLVYAHGATDSTLLGGNGNDIFYLYDGQWEINGGDGEDRLYLISSEVDKGLHVDMQNADPEADINLVVSGLEAILGTSDDDRILSASAGENIDARGGDNFINSRSGDDSLTSEDGNDTIRAGKGDDTVEFNGGLDRVDLGDGDDLWYVNGVSSSYSVYNRATVIGGNGDDTVMTNGYEVPLTVEGNAGNDSIEGSSWSDWISGGQGNDTILGGTGADTILGGAGNDRVISPGYNLHVELGAGDDTFSSSSSSRTSEDAVWGGQGNDLIEAGDKETIAYGGAGNDTIEIAGDRSEAYGAAGEDYLTSRSSAQSDAAYLFNGGTGNDTVMGNSGDDKFIDGENKNSAGDDLVMGGAGDDTLISDHGADFLKGEDGNDLIKGGTGDNQITGGTGEDELWGRGGRDEIVGGAGNDTLRGGAGKDTLTGGSDTDTFDFSDTNFGYDFVTDFRVEDVVRITSPGEALDRGAFLAALVQTSDGVLYDLGADQVNRILFEGATIADLEAATLVFV